MQTPYEMLQGWGDLHAGSRWLYGPLDFFKLVCHNECMFDIFRNKSHKSSPTPRDAEGQLPVPDYDEELSSYYSRITRELTRATGLLDEDRAERITKEQEYQRERAEAIRRRTEFLKKTESVPAPPNYMHCGYVPTWHRVVKSPIVVTGIFHNRISKKAIQ